jgi:ABC-type lipoprotein release transport system permease subunit
MTRKISKKKTNRIITIAGIAIIAGIVVFMISLQIQNSKNNEFRKSLDNIANDTVVLSRQYQAEEGKWVNKQYDNKTMINIVNNYLPRYQALIDKAKALDTPDKFKSAQGFLVSAIQTEKESNEHFRNYLISDNSTEYKVSSDLLSKSLADSANYDSAIRAT